MSRFLVGGCMSLAITGAAAAGFQTDSPFALGGNLAYQATGPAHFALASGASFDIWYGLQFNSAPLMPPAPLDANIGVGSGLSSCQVSLNGLPPGTRYIGNFVGSFFDVFADVSPDGLTNFHDTEMLALDLSMVTPFGAMMIRESPTLQSLGHYSITDLGGGLFNVDSYFDVFTELSMDGGKNWIAAQGSTRIELVPAPGALALLGACGLLKTGRRRRL